MVRSAAAPAPLSISTVEHAGEWDHAIDGLGGHLLQSWRWGEFKSRHGWAPRRLLLSRGGRPIVAAQLLFRSVGPFSIGYAPRGPAARGAAPADLAAVTTAIDGLRSRGLTAATFLEPDTSDLALPVTGSLAWRPSPDSFQPKRSIKVPVDRCDDDLLAAMKPKTRYNVRLAERRGVIGRLGDVTDLPGFYRLMRETAERDQFGIHSVDYYQDALETFGADAALILAEYEGALAAGVLVIRHRDEAIYMYGASATALQRHMPAYLTQFEAMRWARDRGCRQYDLWGIPHDDEVPPTETDAGAGSLNVRDGLWGVYRFKQGFGGVVVEYPGVFERVSMPAVIRVWRRLGRSLG